MEEEKKNDICNILQRFKSYSFNVHTVEKCTQMEGCILSY
jgi:hypothetical protein